MCTGVPLTELKNTYRNTYLLTPWKRVLLEKLTSSAASQEMPRIFGTRKYLTVLTSARHLSLSWANSIQSPQTPPTSWRSILILSSHLCLGLPNGLFPSGFLTRTLIHRYIYTYHYSIIIQTSLFVLKFRLPKCKPNFSKVSRTIWKVEQASFRL